MRVPYTHEAKKSFKFSLKKCWSKMKFTGLGEGELIGSAMEISTHRLFICLLYAEKEELNK